MRTAVRAVLALAIALPLAAQQPAAPDLSIDAIFGRGAFAGQPMPEIAWLRDGNSWITTRPNAAGGDDIVRVEAASGNTTVLIDAASLVDPDGKPWRIDAISLSTDGKRALVFHNTVRVWRTNTKGVYSLVDFTTKKVSPVSTRAGLQMFAKLSPDGARAAFVRDNNLFVVDLATGEERAVTRDGSDVIINGTSDWVYEEELGLRDGFSWSPDGTRIAFYRFDQSPEPQYPLLDQSEVHAKTTLIRYPQPGDANAKVKIGVADIASGHIEWMLTDADSAYLATMAWLDKDSLAIQQLDRRQNRIDLLFASAATGGVRRVLVEGSDAWVEVDHGAPYMIDGGKMFLWPSEQSGWRRYYLYQRDGTPVRAITRDSVDAQGIAGITKSGDVLVTEASPSALERQVYAYRIGHPKDRTRVTTEAGTHTVSLSPDGAFLVDAHAAAALPRAVVLRAYPSLKTVRDLAPNTELRARMAKLMKRPAFIRIPMPDGEQLNAFRIVAPDFDSTKPHPVLIYVYGGPNSQMVVDNFTGSRELWHHFLANKGYVVLSVDNRGTGARGAKFRHAVYKRLGQLESRDQIDAARWIGRQRWADSTRIALWGWSGGGYLTALATSRGGSVYKSGIVVAPVIDFRLYDDIWTERYLLTPAENPDGYKKGSVLTYTNGLTARLLLVHGTSDDNVHPQNIFWLANALQAQGTQFEMMMYPGRTHSISGGNTQVHLYQMMTDYLDRTIGVAATGGAK